MNDKKKCRVISKLAVPIAHASFIKDKNSSLIFIFIFLSLVTFSDPFGWNSIQFLFILVQILKWTRRNDDGFRFHIAHHLNREYIDCGTIGGLGNSI